MHKIKNYFSKSDIVLWSLSVLFITVSFFCFDRKNLITLIASLTGVTSLIFSAKGNPAGQFMMIVFSVLYGIISYRILYYGEMITYLGMTMPMSVLSLVSWIKNPFEGNQSEVKVNNITVIEVWFLVFLTAFVTYIFYCILRFFGTANLIPGTLSVATSFAAVYLTFRRSPYFALAYAANDIVLIVLWILASRSEIRYIPVVVCFAAFLANDVYGYICWQKMRERQIKH